MLLLAPRDRRLAILDLLLIVEINALLDIFARAASIGTHACHSRVCTPLLIRVIARLLPLPCLRTGVSARKSVNSIHNALYVCAPCQQRKGYPQYYIYFLSDNHYQQHRVDHIEKCNGTDIPSSSCYDIDITGMHVPAPLLYRSRSIDDIF